MTLEIALDADEEWDSSRAWDRIVRTAAEAAVAESGFPQLATCMRPVEISVTLTGNDEVQVLNAKWRGKDRPTNVLSFPMVEEGDLRSASVAGPELLLGDIVLAHGLCSAEAIGKGLSIEDHAAHLVVHGTLHLLGYDHHEDQQASEMEAREVRALGRIGIANPYEMIA